MALQNFEQLVEKLFEKKLFLDFVSKRLNQVFNPGTKVVQSIFHANGKIHLRKMEIPAKIMVSEKKIFVNITFGKQFIRKRGHLEYKIRKNDDHLNVFETRTPTLPNLTVSFSPTSSHPIKLPHATSF